MPPMPPLPCKRWYIVPWTVPWTLAVSANGQWQWAHEGSMQALMQLRAPRCAPASQTQELLSPDHKRIMPVCFQRRGGPISSATQQFAECAFICHSILEPLHQMRIACMWLRIRQVRLVTNMFQAFHCICSEHNERNEADEWPQVVFERKSVHRPTWHDIYT